MKVVQYFVNVFCSNCIMRFYSVCCALSTYDVTDNHIEYITLMTDIHLLYACGLVYCIGNNQIQIKLYNYFRVGFTDAFSFGAVMLLKLNTTDEFDPCNKKLCNENS